MSGIRCRLVCSRLRTDIAAELAAVNVVPGAGMIRRWQSFRYILAVGSASAAFKRICAEAPGTVTAGGKGSAALLAGTGSFEMLVRYLRINGFTSGADAAALAVKGGRNRTMLCRGRRLNLSKTRVMGILNVTPDSFSDGGKYALQDKAVEQALRMEAGGAAVIDVGGESTRPGARAVPAKEEATRVVPVIRALSKKLKKSLISVDTCKSGVARAALDAGAHMVNDISGMRFDKKMAGVTANAGAAAVLMHILGTPRTMQRKPAYGHLMHDVFGYLAESADRALQAGIGPKSIAVDPGIGFGKTMDHNLELLRRLPEFAGLGFPVLVGASRKSFIGLTLNLPVEKRLEGSLAAAVAAVAGGARLVRVHDVKETCRAVALADAIYNRY